MAISRKATPRYCSRKLPRTPNLSSVSLMEEGTFPVATFAMIPNAKPAPAAPTHQPTSTGSSSRTASPHGEPRPNLRGGTTSRDASVPAPTSRRAASTTDAATSTTTVTAASTRGRGSLSVSGRMRSIQPNGDNHRSHRVLEPESASMRRTKATPKTTMPSVVATRRVRPSCDVERADRHEDRRSDGDAQREEDGLAGPEADVGVGRHQEGAERGAAEHDGDGDAQRGQRRPRRPRGARRCRPARATSGRRPPRLGAGEWRRGGPRSPRSWSGRRSTCRPCSRRRCRWPRPVRAGSRCPRRRSCWRRAGRGWPGRGSC